MQIKFLQSRQRKSKQGKRIIITIVITTINGYFVLVLQLSMLCVLIVHNN